MPINRELSQFGSFVEVANSTKLGIVNPNVGIGTTNPTVKVEVHGDIKVVDGNIDANGNLDVDGYSDLDELNVTGIATFTNGIQCSGSAMNVTAGFVANTARVSDLTDNRVVIAGNSGELEGDSNFTFDGSTLSVGADFTLTGIDTGTSAGPEFKLFRNSSSPEDADYLGQIKFAGESDTGVERNYAKITGKILDASNGTEDGIIEFAHIKAGSQNISARFRSDSLQLLNGTNFSVAGDSTLTGDLDVDGHTDLDYVAVSAAATFTSLVDVNGGLQANTIKIEDLTDNRVVIAGVGGELEDNSKFTFNGETVNINAQLTVSGVSTFSGGISMGSGSVGLTTNSITGPAEMFIDPAAVGDNTGVVRIKGDLYVDGTTTQINSETLTIADFVVGIASTATTDSLADGAGINIGPDNTFKYDHTNTSLKSSENLNVASGKTYKVNGTDVLSATTLGSAVVSSSLTSVGTLSALTVSGDVSIADKIIHTGDTNTAIRFPAADIFSVETAGTERLRVTSANGGNLLVGMSTVYNTNASVQIRNGINIVAEDDDGNVTEVDNAGEPVGRILFGDTRPGKYASIDCIADGTCGTNDYPGRLVFRTTSDGSGSTAERMRITSTGKLEAYKGTSTTGKTSGSEAFTVGNGAGNHRFAVYPDGTTVIGGTGLIGNYNILLQNDGVGVFDNQLLIGITTGVGVGGVPADLNSTEVGRGFINISRDDTAAADHILFGKNGSIAASIGTDTTNTLVFKTGTSEALRINSTGEIVSYNGTLKRDVSDSSFTVTGDTASNTGANINLYGASHSSLANIFRVRIGASEKLRIDSSGRMLLGTTTEGEANADDFTIATSAHTGMTIRSGTANRGNIYFSDGTSGDAEYRGYVTYDHDGDKFKFGTANADRLVILSDGKVGINSATPAVQLHINSTDAIRVPVGTTGERPTGAAGYIRYNSSIASYEGHNGSEWAGIGGAAEVETAVSSTSATTCESFAKASYRSASIVAQITQGSSYQVGNYLLIHDGTTATLVEESAVATGDMLGTFTATISGSNVVFQVNMNSASSATVTSKMTKVSIP